MTIAVPSVYDSLAGLLAYPQAGYPHRVRETIALLPEGHAEAARHLEAFAAQLEGQSDEQIEELFTRTFDVNPICCLEVGWHLFGDNYDRGDFLVRMRQNLRQLGLEETNELPDHLMHVLPMVPRLAPAEGEELAAKSIVPAIDKMLQGLGGKDSPYEKVLLAIRQVLGEVSTAPAGGVR